MLYRTIKKSVCCLIVAVMAVTMMPCVTGWMQSGENETVCYAAASGLSVKNLWASQHDVGKVLFKWSKKAGVTVSGWNLKYRTRKIGGNNKWSGWTTKSYGTGTLEAWIPVRTDYVIEIHAQGKGDSTWSNGIITCPAGGRYQAMKATHVVNAVTGKRLSESKEGDSAIYYTDINLKVGDSFKVKPDYEYSVRDYKRRPRLYPNHLLYDIGDKSMITITKPDGSRYNGGIIDGVATIKATKAGKTTIIFRSPNGRTMIANVIVQRYATEEDKGSYNTYVFFGSDSRAVGDAWKTDDSLGTEGAPRSDTIMLLQVDDADKRINVISVLRDTLLDISGNGTNFQKANKAYADGGPYNAVDMLEKNLDIRITGYVSSNFKGVADVIDALDGVNITIEDDTIPESSSVPVKYHNKKVPDVMNALIDEMNRVYGTDAEYVSETGTALNLSGMQAVAYARVRYTDGGDMRRTMRQRTVLKQMISQYNQAAPETQQAAINDTLAAIDTDLAPDELGDLIDKVCDYEVVDCTFPFYKRFDTILSAEEDEGGRSNVFVPADLATNVTELHKRIYGEDWYMPSTTVQNYSNIILKTKNCDTIKNEEGVVIGYTEGVVMGYTYEKRDTRYDNY